MADPMTDHDLLIRIDERVADLIENDKIQNGALAENVKGVAVLKGQFSLAKWIIGVTSVPVVLAAFSELSGYAP